MKHSNFNGKHAFKDLEDLKNILCADISDPLARNQLLKALAHVSEVQDENDPRPLSTDVAITLKLLGVDTQTLSAALLCDPRLRDKVEPLQIELEFNESIANLVKHVHWMNTFKVAAETVEETPTQVEALRKMLLATVDDVRAVLIRLAFRVQRLRGLSQEPKEIQVGVARETLDIFSPLANRLGIGELKWEMEDLAFRYLEPEQYMAIATSMAANRAQREIYINNFVKRLLQILENENIPATAYGRAKHLYSIWKKMQRKHQQVHELADLLAMRVVVDTIPQCYLVLGLVHGLWQHLPQEFDDYIASPKENGYQSIHTAILGPKQQIIEIQIRTQEMQEFAEHGIAAHWRYKEGSSQDIAMEKTIATLRRLLENQSDDDILLEEFKTDFFNDRVLVLTPKGTVMDLPRRATALDFAYFVHTEVGNHCIGAKVNSHRVPLSYPLNSGERVEILTNPGSRPNLNWLNPRKKIVTTSKAITAIRSWFRTHYKDTDNTQLISSKNLSGVGAHKIITASCCKPRIGDRIIGIYREDSSIIVHQSNCPQVDRSRDDHYILELEWGEQTNKTRITLHVEAFDRQGLLQDITTLLNQFQVNVLKANTETDTADQSVTMALFVELDSTDQIGHLLKRIEHIPNVFSAYETE